MSRKWDTEKFIKFADSIRGNEYNYNKFIYKNSYTKGIIIHRTCGNEFLQSPNAHISKIWLSSLWRDV